MRRASCPIIILFFICFVGWKMESPVSAAVIAIPADEPNIQAGIDRADDGDTVLVADGMYSGEGNTHIDYNGKSIIVRSENGPDRCILDAQKTSPIVYFQHQETDQSILDGFTLQHAEGGFEDKGGAIRCDIGSNPTIRNCHFTANTSGYGAGIYIFRGSPTIQHCLFDRNISLFNGAAIYCSRSIPEIVDCEFAFNASDNGWGGGIFAASRSVIRLTGCTFHNNSGQYGGAIAVQYSEINLTQTQLNENQAWMGGAIHAGRSSGFLENVQINRNSAGQNGGGIFFNHDSSIETDTCSFVENTAEYGGAVYFHYSSSGTISGCSFSNNFASESGGAVYIQPHAYPVFRRNTISGNGAGFSGGGMYVNAQYRDDEIHRPIIGGEVGAGNTFEYNYAGIGSDIAGSLVPEYPLIHAQYNLFRGTIDLPYYVLYPETFDLTGSQSDLIPITQDVYVSPNGNDTDDGLSPETPFQTIQHALSVISAGPDMPITIHLAPGLYSRSHSGERFPLSIPDHVTIQGSHPQDVILDIEGKSRGIVVYESTGGSIRDVTIQTGRSKIGGGMCIIYSNASVHHCIFANNAAIAESWENTMIYKNPWADWLYGGLGGAIFCSNSESTITSCSFIDNVANSEGGAVAYYHAQDSSLGGSLETRNDFHHNRSGHGVGADLTAIETYPAISAQYNHFTGDHRSTRYVGHPDSFDLENCVSELQWIHQDVFVNPSGDDTNDGLSEMTPFRTISHAINMVQGTSENPLVIHLAPGIYSPSSNGERFPLYLTSYITLQGDSSSNTILDAERTDRVVHSVNEDQIRLSELTITGGRSSQGGGIRIIGSSDANIEHCLINRNHAFHGRIPSCGGGAYFEETDISMAYCDIAENRTVGQSGYGGGIYAWFSPSGSFMNCNIYGNRASTGAGIFGAHMPKNISCDIYNNVATQCGAGIFMACRGEISSCRIFSNHGFQGGGIACDSVYSDSSFTNCLIQGNTADFGAGVLYSDEYTAPAMRNSTVVNNIATQDGGGLFFSSRPPASVENTIFYGNQPTQIDTVYGANIDIHHSVIEGGYPGDFNLNANPLFVRGPLGSFYLSSRAAGQPIDSPCINAGSGPAQDHCYSSPDGTICMSDLTTRTDHIMDIDTVDIGYHYPPVEIPPTPTPQPTMTPTNTPAPNELIVDLQLSQDTFSAGDTFVLETLIHRSGTMLFNHHLAILLDVHSIYFFYPTWTQTFTAEPIDIYPGTVERTILDFIWPETDSSEEHLMFYGAILDPSMTAIVGEWDMVTFGWTDH